MEKIPQFSPENEKKMEKDRFRQEIESLHTEYINLKPLQAEMIAISNKYRELSGRFLPYSKLESEMSQGDRKRIHEIREREEILNEKIREQNKKGMHIFYKNFSPSDWKIEEDIGIYKGGKHCRTDIGGGYIFNVRFFEVDPGQPAVDPFSKDKYIREYTAYVSGDKEIKGGLFKKSRLEYFPSLGNYAEISFEDDKSISERQNEFEGKDEFEKELIGLANKLGGIQK